MRSTNLFSFLSTSLVLRTAALLAATGTLMLTSACVGEVASEDDASEDEATASDAQALGEAACATVEADAAVSGRIGDLITPATYSAPGCYKAYITDLNRTSFDGDLTTVTWAGPNTPAACNDSVMYLQVYKKSGTKWVAEGAKQTKRGSWVEAGGLAICDAPGFIVSQGAGGSSYRFAASARVVSTGATVPIELFTQRRF
ncbi:hypothetical protein WME79_41935 [Sorangium sp. So ce726]|uniref:hypothetical protein n=1 Tax=Sorangium sp. So ce726 TaxID=3133319 RepID=UPI003F5ECCC9